jgi:glycosyltransferase involved in cell wall biosynthesis
MRVAIDAASAASERRTGVGNYAWNLIHLLPQIDPESTYVAWYLGTPAMLRPWRLRRLLKELSQPNVVNRVTPLPRRHFERLWHRFGVPTAEWFVRFDVFFAPAFVPPPTRTRSLVLTVHDLAFRLYPETSPDANWMARLKPALSQAARIIAVSEQTRQDLLSLYPVDPERVAVVPLGVDRERFRPPSPNAIEAARRRYRISSPYLLAVGDIDPRKNLPSVVRAFASLPDDQRAALVVAGAPAAWNPSGVAQLQEALRALPERVQKRIVLTGYVPQKDVVALMGGAEALIHVSLYEGFGLPVLEAMACGTAVLTSNVSALPETAGGAALLVDPRDVHAIANGMHMLLTDNVLRRRLEEQGFVRASAFDWRTTATQTAKILHEAAG